MAQLHKLIDLKLLGVGIAISVASYALKLVINYRNTIAAFNHLPGYRAFLSHRASISQVLPAWKYFNSLEAFQYWNKFERMSVVYVSRVVSADHYPNVQGLKRLVSTSFLL